MHRYSDTRRVFGPVDPYCVLPVAALAGVAVTLVTTGAVGFAIALGALAGLIVAFDSWANRHEPLSHQPPAPSRYDSREWR